MSMKRKSEPSLEQQDLWIPKSTIVEAPAHPFYNKLNKIFSENKFDEHVESLCEKFYKEGGRPSIAPGVYFRMLFSGFFENIESERNIAWRCSDSLALRSFLGYELNESTPSHASLSVIRHRLDTETHEAVFSFCLKLLADNGLLKGGDIGIDATNIEANAAMSSIVRRDTGDSYKQYLYKLAKESDEEINGLEDLARFDKNRKKTLSNKDWESKTDPDARISKMKQGNTRMTYKVEHACDLEKGAVVAVNVATADKGDTTTIKLSVSKAALNLEKILKLKSSNGTFKTSILQSVVADKGYHSKAIIENLTVCGVRTYISEPKRGKLRWNGKMRTQWSYYGNRRRIKSKRGVKLRKQRAEKVERSFAHIYTSGNLRRTYLRGRENVEKRLLMHVAAFNISLLMRSKLGVGKPRSLHNRSRSADISRNGQLSSYLGDKSGNSCGGLSYMRYTGMRFSGILSIGVKYERWFWR